MANENEQIAPDMSKIKLVDLEAKAPAGPQEHGYYVWWLKNVQKLADGYQVDFGNYCANPGDKNWIGVFKGGNLKTWNWAPEKSGTVKITTTPENGDYLVYYVQAFLETGWPVYVLHP